MLNATHAAGAQHELNGPAIVEESFSWRTQQEDGVLRLTVDGSLTIAEAPKLWPRVLKAIELGGHAKTVRLDLSQLNVLDGACAALLVHLKQKLQAQRVRCVIEGSEQAVVTLRHLDRRLSRGRRRARRQPRSAIEQVGAVTEHFAAEVGSILEFLGALLRSTAYALRNPRSVNLKDVGLTMERTGADAAPIVMLINFLIGFVMAYQSALHLRKFGADLFVADLVGISVTRELAPLMTAIIVCGRSGAAFAAELGTMKVSEEIDALRTLGVLPLRYLVVPRMIGLVMVMPILTLLGGVVAIGGGLLVGLFTLQIAPVTYLIETRSAVHFGDVLSGLLKSVVFGVAVSLIACHHGLKTARGAEGVGRSTTSAVVSILFCLILLDAVFTVALGVFDL